MQRSMPAKMLKPFVWTLTIQPKLAPNVPTPKLTPPSSQGRGETVALRRSSFHV